MSKHRALLEVLAPHREVWLTGLQMVRLRPDRLKRGHVYVYLTELEDGGLVASRAHDDQIEGLTLGAHRREYQITPKGRAALANPEPIWKQMGMPPLDPKFAGQTA
jgi:hypothetical protein